MRKPNIISATGGAVPRGLAAALAGGNYAGGLRSLTPLPDNAQRLFDEVAVDVAFDRLSVVRRMLERNLRFDLPNWVAVPELYWEKKSRAGHAQRTMRPGSNEARQQHDREGVTYPIYATVDGFSFHERELATAERAGVPLDADHLVQAIQNVNEAIEDAAINGGMQVGGNASPGFLGAPNVNTVTYTGSEAWDAAGHTGAEILTDVLAMATQLKNDNYYGPYELFIPTDYENKMGEDYVSGYPKTIGQRLRELEFGGENLTITVADLLPDDRTVLMQATRNVADVVVGQQPTLISWMPNPFETEFLVVGCVIVRVKDDYDDKSGICTGNV